MGIHSMLKFMSILHQEWTFKNCGMMSSGPENISPCDEWAAKKKSLEPAPPAINDDQSLSSTFGWTYNCL